MQYLKFSIRKSRTIALSVIVLAFAGCSKGGDSPSPTPPPTPPPVVVTESDIAFKVDIAGAEVNYSAVFPVVGTSVAMNANITSTLPKEEISLNGYSIFVIGSIFIRSPSWIFATKFFICSSSQILILPSNSIESAAPRIRCI